MSFEKRRRDISISVHGGSPDAGEDLRARAGNLRPPAKIFGTPLACTR
jgi:hypothetical protein